MERNVKKYAGLQLLLALTVSSLLGLRAAAGTAETGLTRADLTDSQLHTLNQRLDSRITEQKQILDLMQKLLEIDQRQQPRPAPGTALAAPAKPVVAAKPVAPPKAAPVTVATAPWWQSYQVSMAYGAGKDAYAVVNGKLVGLGQPVAGKVVVFSVQPDVVVLRQGLETHAYRLGN